MTEPLLFHLDSQHQKLPTIHGDLPLRKATTPFRTAEKPLRFTPYAWSKLLFLRDEVDTEITMMGITAHEDDPMLVTDMIVPNQRCTQASCDIDCEDLADQYDKMDALGLQPWQYSSIWMHTHPGQSPNPSGQDEQTFAERVGPWSIMFILAKGGDVYCRLRTTQPQRVEVMLPVQIDYGADCPAIQHDDWKSLPDAVAEGYVVNKLALARKINEPAAAVSIRDPRADYGWRGDDEQADWTTYEPDEDYAAEIAQLYTLDEIEDLVEIYERDAANGDPIAQWEMACHNRAIELVQAREITIYD